MDLSGPGLDARRRNPAHRADFSKGTYNFEEKRRDAVIVRASDGQGGRVSLDVNIEVTNVDE